MFNHKYIRDGSLIAGGAVVGVLVVLLINYKPCPDYIYLNHGAVCGKGPVINKAGYVVLQNDIEQLIAQQKAAGMVIDASVYFRDLRNGPVFGISGDHHFIPASLLKLPMMLAFFSLREDQPDILNTRLEYSMNALKGVDIPPGITLPPELEIGKKYSVEELIESTIVHSDNFAYFILVAYLQNSVPGGPQKVLRTLQEIGIADPRDIEEPAMSARSYAAIFRLLYNASYLDPADSEKVLTWLVKAAYNDGLKAGIPQDVSLAHKFGRREVSDGTLELHDCGIVYYPENPYVLCVMTHGKDEEDLKSFIATISKMTYDEVDSRRL